ncbi:MAG TPA: HAD family hydrolase [Blastocatellia bacterium]|nr:HAD family hydrolase [Blastocatellia bacterium]
MFGKLSDSPFRMIACDYDGTIAVDGAMSPIVERALADAQRSGFLIALVTGREFNDLKTVCKRLDMFDLVVAENGAVTYLPGTGIVTDLATPPSSNFVAELTREKISFSVGRVVVGIDSAEADRLRTIIRDLGLQLEITLNRDSAMILPAGINKATGLEEGVRKLGIRLSHVIAVGDAENDIPFMGACGYAVAVANAIESVKAVADTVTDEPNGEGVAKFINNRLLRPTAEGIPVRPTGTEIVY